MDYTTPMREFARYLVEDADQGDPDAYFDLCRELLGCTEVLPGAIKAILVDDEGLDEDATTYHEAAISALTELVIDTQDLSTWQRDLMPVYEADMVFSLGTVHPRDSGRGSGPWSMKTI